MAMSEAKIERSRLVLILPSELGPVEGSTGGGPTSGLATGAAIPEEEIAYEVAAPPLPIAVGNELSVRRGGTERTYVVASLVHRLEEQGGTVVHTLYVTLEHGGGWTICAPGTMDADVEG